MLGFNTINDFLGGGGYSGLPFGGSLSPEEVGELVKALNVGSDRDPPSTFQPGDGFAFRVEDLDPLMRVSTFDMTNIVMWKLLQKMAAENTVVEWNDRQQYGVDGLDGFMPDGGLPEQMDGTVARNYAFVKFLGVQAAITHGSTLVKSANGNLVAQETQAKMMMLLSLVEKHLMYASSALDPTQWDGFFTQMTNAVTAGKAPATQIKDMRGKNITVEDVEEGAGLTASEPNYGRLTDMFCNPMVKSDISASVLPANRGIQGGTSANGAIGGKFERIDTTIGEVNVHPDAFINFGRHWSSTGLGDPIRRPPTPSLSVAPSTPSDGASLFGPSDAGTYTYSVVARNRFGASPPLAISGVTPASGQSVNFSIAAMPGNPTFFFEIYRSTKNGTTALEGLIARIPNPNQGFGAVAFVDENFDLPNTSSALAVQWEPSIINFRQLLPVMKIALAQIDLNVRWVQAIYGVPILYIPKRAYMFKNIGRAARAA